MDEQHISFEQPSRDESPRKVPVAQPAKVSVQLDTAKSRHNIQQEEVLPVPLGKTPAQDDVRPEQSSVLLQPGLDRMKNVVVSLVVCEDRLVEAMALIKSIVMFTRAHPHFHIFADDTNFEKMSNGTLAQLADVSTEIHRVDLPDQSWKKLFKPCASQRLFLPSLLPNVERTLYMDTDTLLLSDVQDLWQVFDNFSADNDAAMAPEGEERNLNWYARFARHPFFGALGLNSGVMLMDLKRMRENSFVDIVKQIYENHRQNIVWGDQDILNIYYAKHPERMHAALDCSYNYRPDHCLYGQNCKAVAQHGARIIHGNRGVFRNTQTTPNVRQSNIIPAFRNLWNMIVAAKGKPLSKTAVADYIDSLDDSYCARAAKEAVQHLL